MQINNIKNIVVSSMNDFMYNVSVYNDSRAFLQKASLPLRKTILKEKIVDYTSYGFEYLYTLCRNNDQLFLQVLPDVLDKNIMLALLFVDQTVLSNKNSYSVRTSIIPKAIIQNIFNICLKAILKDVDYCDVYILHNISPLYRSFESFDSVIQDFFKQIYDLYINQLLVKYKYAPSKMMKLFCCTYPFLTADDINIMLQTLVRKIRGSETYECEMKLIYEKINVLKNSKNLVINEHNFNKIYSVLFLSLIKEK